MNFPFANKMILNELSISQNMRKMIFQFEFGSLNLNEVLEYRTKTRKEFTFEQILQIILFLVNSMMELRKFRISHRNLNLENVIFPEENPGTMKICG